MRTYIAFFGCLLALGAGCGDSGGSGSGWEPLSFRLDEDRILTDVGFLASEPCAGREPGTIGMENALAHVESLFAELDLEPPGAVPSFRKPFDLEAWHLEALPTVQLGSTALDPAGEIRVPRYAGSGQVEAEVVFVGYGLRLEPYDGGLYPDCPLDPLLGYDDFAGVDVAGKVVLVLRYGFRGDEGLLGDCPMETDWTFSLKAQHAIQASAAAVIFVQDGSHAGEPIPAVSIRREMSDPGVPILFVDRAKVEGVLPELATWEAAIDETLLPQSRATGVQAALEVSTSREWIRPASLLGAVPGRDASLRHEVVVVSAHLDHIGQDLLTGGYYPGADDNASGVAVIMELARLLRSLPEPPARTVLFAAWSAEEQGLVGSCSYVSQPLYPLADTLAMFSVDMVGAGDGSALVLSGATEPGNAWLAEVMQGAAADEGLAHGVYPFTPVYASDHACFAMAGVPALLVSSFGEHGLYHTLGDTLETIDKEDLKMSAELMWAALRVLARGTEADYL